MSGSCGDGDDTSSTAHRYSWDVFLSFRGEDTRHGFVASLYDELVRHGVRAFRDDEGMERGDEIAPTLLAAIEDSAAAIAVISENYANSKWCLEELAKIFDCKRLMVPVFYRVDPSDVRWQRGSFASDFGKHEREVAEEKVNRWKNAMNHAGNISGFDSRLWDESELIKILVKKILKELNNTPLGVAKYPVGLETRVEILLRKLDVTANDVRVIGFYGMGGIGKTTLAKALYNKLIVHFKKRSFLLSVREESQKPNGLESLQGKLLGDLNSSTPETIYNTRRGKVYIKEVTHENPVLLVLDDVDNHDQLDLLAGGRDWFHDGSRIIITSRDKEVLVNNIVNEIYEVGELSSGEAVKLFSYHAFGREHPSKDFKQISEEIVSLTGGLPLALEVFGSSLFYKRRMKEWADALEKLKKIRPRHLQDVLEISFGALDDEERCIFLDIACFFVRMKMKREDAIDIFNGCGFRAETALTELTAKSLIKIVDENVLWMHDQLRDMGKEIVQRENYRDAGQRSRLWDQEEILKVLKNGKGTKSIEGISLNLIKKDIPSSESGENNKLAFGIKFLKKIFNRTIISGDEKDDEAIYAEDFRPMVNLRLLEINNAKLLGNFKLIPAELKWLQWKGCPLKVLPMEFPSQDLAVLDLSESKISKLWSQGGSQIEGKKMGNKLSVVNLRACRDLEEIPYFCEDSLEKLLLSYCSSLVAIPESIGDMNKLKYLNLEECKNLVKFPSDVSGLKSLEKLILSGCRRLRDLPKDMSGLKSLKELHLDRTAIVELPFSIFNLKNLEILNINDCGSLAALPKSIGNLRSLRELSLDDSVLHEMPESIGQLTNLEKLSLRRCKSLSLLPDTIGDLLALTELNLDFSIIKNVPLSIGSLCHLRFLSMHHCRNLTLLPDSMGRLSSLVYLNLSGTCISELPGQIGDLNSLEKLDMGNCQSLSCLPESIGNLSNLKSLVLSDLSISDLPESFGLMERLETLHLTNCKSLQKLPASFGGLKSLSYLYMEGTDVAELPSDIGKLSNLKLLKMRKQPNTGRAPVSNRPLPLSVSELSKLQTLDAHAFGISGEIPDNIAKLTSLQKLDLGYSSICSFPSSLTGLSVLEELLLPHCKELKTIPPLPSSLLTLNVANCLALENISDVSNLGNLRQIEFTNCEKIIDIPGLEHLKSLKWLYAGGCKACLPAIKKRLSKVALRRIRYLSLPGSEIPNWFVQEVPIYSRPKNRDLKGIIIALVISLDQQLLDGFRDKIPAIVDIQAKIMRRGETPLTTTLRLLGVPNTDEDQFYLCRYHDSNNLVFMLEEGDSLCVAMRPTPYFNGITLKKHGIHFVFENDDDYEDCDEALFNDESQQSVSKRLSNFFDSL